MCAAGRIWRPWCIKDSSRPVGQWLESPISAPSAVQPDCARFTCLSLKTGSARVTRAGHGRMTQTRHLNSDGTPKYTNRLASETTPYLRKHAHNPVEWYPWGPEALERASRENKPIHLSVGYSACHWCSVLEKESFEDEATAKILNDNFINIKVDREERPDIDRIYQIAQQMLTQR